MREEPFFERVILRRENLNPDCYPFAIPAVQQIEKIRFHPGVTYITGENAIGKSTIVEAIAIAAGFNAEGGRKSYATEQQSTDLRLADSITLARRPGKEKDGFFLRAESTYVLFNYIKEVSNASELIRDYGGDLHHRSHGESFMQLFNHRLKNLRDALFIFDELESALSPQRQLEFLALMHEYVKRDCMFIVSTHSPIMMGYPHSRLYWLSSDGIEERTWKDTDHYQIYHAWLTRSEKMLKHLLSPSYGHGLSGPE